MINKGTIISSECHIFKGKTFKIQTYKNQPFHILSWKI